MEETRLVPPAVDDEPKMTKVQEALPSAYDLERFADGSYDSQEEARQQGTNELVLAMKDKTIKSLEMERDALRRELEKQMNKAQYFEHKATSYRDALINICKEVGGDN